MVQPELNQTPRITRGTRSSSGSRCRWGTLDLQGRSLSDDGGAHQAVLIRLELGRLGSTATEVGSVRRGATVSSGRLLRSSTKREGREGWRAEEPYSGQGPGQRDSTSRALQR